MIKCWPKGQHFTLEVETLADKITKFEDYKRKDNVGDTTDIDIQIEDPMNFFNAQEREEFYQERLKEQEREQAQQRPPMQRPVEQNAQPQYQEPVQPQIQPQPQYSQDDYSQLVDNAWNKDQGFNQNLPGNDGRDYEDDYDPEYDEDYEDGYDEGYDEEDDSEGGFPIELFVRISSIITGVIILAFLAIVLKVKVYDRYLAPDPDEEQVTVSELALPSGYTEKNDTVVVTAEMLNLRSVDNSSSKDTIMGTVNKGTELKRVAVNADNSWALVDYNGQRLYASMKYLEVK